MTRIINSDEIQSVVRPAKDTVLNARGRTKRKNPLINKSALYRLNPYAKTLKANELGAFSGPVSFTAYHVSYSQLDCLSFLARQKAASDAKKKGVKKPKSAGKEFLATLFAP